MGKEYETLKDAYSAAKITGGTAVRLEAKNYNLNQQEVDKLNDDETYFAFITADDTGNLQLIPTNEENAPAQPAQPNKMLNRETKSGMPDVDLAYIAGELSRETRRKITQPDVIRLLGYGCIIEQLAEQMNWIITSEKEHEELTQMREAENKVKAPMPEPAATEPNGPKYPEVKVKLTGEDGNAFAIIGRAQAAAKGKLTKDELEAFRNEAMTGDYNHVLATVMKWFDTK